MEVVIFAFGLSILSLEYIGNIFYANCETLHLKSSSTDLRTVVTVFGIWTKLSEFRVIAQ